jgi:hypothetical protein
MEFELQFSVFTFGDKADSTKYIRYSVVSRSVVIDMALGSRGELNLGGDRVGGVHTLGATCRVPVTCTES